MKKSILLLFTVLLFCVGYAQQFPLQSQYQFNYASINPAAVGEHDFYRARLSIRNQWVGLTETPIATQMVTVTKGIEKNGLGVTVFNDKTGGAFNKSGFSLSYAHKVQFSNSQLFLGVSAGGAKVNFDATSDPAILTTDDIVPEAVFGAYYKIKDFKLGVSIPGLLGANMDITASTDNTIKRHFYTMMSYEKQLNEMLSIYPSVLIKTTANHNQIDANINFKLKDIIWFGTSYRQSFGPTLYVGLDLGRILSIYSYDISTNEVSGYSAGSHELTFGYDFIPEPNTEVFFETPKVEDKDGDGVIDSEDLCPEIPGLAKANGCPDFDKDGIPDRFDLCPHLFGVDMVQGCPELTTEEQALLSEVLEDLEFKVNSDEIKYVSYSSLTELTKLLHTNPTMTLTITGHASPEGTAKQNLGLSARRAKRVQNYFIERGVPKSRLVIEFYGGQIPLNANETEWERTQNRRVEFDIKFHKYDDASAEQLKNQYQKELDKMFPNDSVTVIEIVTENTEHDIVENKINPDAIVSFTTTYDSILYEEFNEEEKVEVIEEENPEPFSIDEDLLVVKVFEEVEVIAEEKPESSSIDEYLLVVKVFEEVVNAINYVNTDENMKYKYVDGKYYVYAYSSIDRKNVEQYRVAYDKECWIKNP